MIPSHVSAVAVSIARAVSRAGQPGAGRSHSRRARAATGIALGLVIGGCAGSTGSPGEIGVSGGVYTDMLMDVACDAVPVPRELVGITLSFTDESDALVGTATTGVPTVLELPTGPGTETWSHGGCRVFAGYEVRLPVRDTYSVDFEARDVARPAGAAYFQGVELLEPQSTSLEELAANGYTWTFEAPSAYVVH